jgi:hypothetical protein
MRAGILSYRNTFLWAGRNSSTSLRTITRPSNVKTIETRLFLQQQSFATSQRRRAEEVDINQQPPIWTKIQENPAIMNAIANFVQVAQREGTVQFD